MKILVCTDGSKNAEMAVKFSAKFAKNYRADLMILRVIKHETSMEKPVFDEYGDEYHRAKNIIKSAEGIISQIAPDITVKNRIAVGPVSAEIIRIAESEKFDCIVIGTRGNRGLRRMLLGSVADEVILYAHCPVVVVR
ncbi:MAG: universal stress protein [Thermodesulfobacteriota bacterium]|nr:universal stress protein [Thermodesulfobacteriota bacterium]